MDEYIQIGGTIYKKIDTPRGIRAKKTNQSYTGSKYYYDLYDYTSQGYKNRVKRYRSPPKPKTPPKNGVAISTQTDFKSIFDDEDDYKLFLASTGLSSSAGGLNLDQIRMISEHILPLDVYQRLTTGSGHYSSRILWENEIQKYILNKYGSYIYRK